MARAAANGPQDMTSPTCAASRASAVERHNGPTASVAITTVVASALMAKPATSGRLQDRAKGAKGDRAPASVRRNSPTPARATIGRAS